MAASSTEPVELNKPAAARKVARVYSPKQIAAAMFLGGLLTACALMARNYHTLGFRRLSWIVFLTGMTAFVLMMLFPEACFDNDALPGFFKDIGPGLIFGVLGDYIFLHQNFEAGLFPHPNRETILQLIKFGLVLPVAPALFYFLSRLWQGRPIRNHLDSGGKTYSAIRVLGAVLLGIISAIGIAMVINLPGIPVE